MDNQTNTNTIALPEPHTYQIVLGCIAFFLVLPFVLVPFSRYPLGSTGAVLVGALLMVVTTVIDQTEVYTIIGDVNNLKTIFLLWGMMIISSFFERERVVDHLLTKLFPAELSFYWWIVRLSIIDSILAALFTNDVACVILTPLVLQKWIEQKRDKKELNTLLLTIATQANIGSTLTIFGNPQMALMASKSNDFVDIHSRLELKTCVEYLWLPVFIVWLLNVGCLMLWFRFSRTNSNDVNSSKDDSSELGTVEQPSISTVISPPTPNLSQCSFSERYRLKRSKLMRDRSVSVASFPSLADEAEQIDESFLPSESRRFKLILFILLLIVIILLFISNSKIYFDIGLVPVGAAIILLVADTFINHRPPIAILTRIDWNVLLLFFGLFVWLSGLNSTGIPHRIWFVHNDYRNSIELFLF